MCGNLAAMDLPDFWSGNACGEFEIAIRDTPLKWTPETARAQRGGYRHGT